MSKVVAAYSQGISDFFARNKPLLLFEKKNLRIDSYRLIYKKNMKEENISFKIS